MASRSTNLDAVILGAGISGLCAGWALRKAGKSFRILEQRHRVGGPMQTIRRDGYLFECGPNTIQVDGPDLIEFFSDLGLDDAVVDANPAANKRYIVKHQRPLALPMGPKELLTTSVLSVKAKFRLLREPFIRPLPAEADESLGDCIRRRLGSEVLDTIVNPFIAGIYAGSPDAISTRYGFPKLREWEQSHGSLIRGAIRSMKAKKQAGKAFKTRLLSFRDGIDTLPRRLAERLDHQTLLHTQIEHIAHHGDRWQVTVAPGDTYTARRLIVALPAQGICQLPLPPEAADMLAPLADIPHPPVSALHLGFRRDQITHPLDGFGLLVPEKEPFSILGVLFNSTLFPGRAPDGAEALTVFVGGTRRPELAQLTDEALMPIVLDDLNQLLGVEGDPTYLDRVHWPKAIPQYDMNHGTRLTAIESAESAFPGLRILGHVRDGIALPKCMRAGLAISDSYS